MNKDTIKIELTREEHMMVTAILFMHYTGFIVEIHKDKRTLLNKITDDFSKRNIRIMAESLKK